MARILEPTAQSIALAAEAIAAGHTVALPTETVYGLGADATNDAAVAAIFAAKERPRFNPLIVHVPDIAAAQRHVEWTPLAQKLAAAFWPGPLTLVLPRTQDCPAAWLSCAGLSTIAVRCPRHATALALITALGHPVAAPSANRSGSISPTTAQHVAESLSDAVPVILDGGASEVGLESSILDLTTDTPTLLRPGGLSREDIEAVIGPIALSSETPSAPKSPGQLLRHYAPALPVRLAATGVSENEALLGFGNVPEGMREKAAAFANLSEHGDLREAAANLFAMMHALDIPGMAGMAIMEIPTHGLGLAINDRLKRAAFRKG